MVIFVSSPYRGNNPDDDPAIEAENLRIARSACLYVMGQGHAPVAPHLYFPQFLDERRIIGDRALATRCCLQMIEKCDELWVFGSCETDGMTAEIVYAEKLEKCVLRVIGPQWENRACPPK